MPRQRIINYFAPEYDEDPVPLRISDQSDVLHVIEHFECRVAGPVGFHLKVAYLPKDVVLKEEPFRYQLDWFQAIASHFEYPRSYIKLFSLELCDEEDRDRVQFFIQSHPDQLQFIPAGEENDHQKMIQHASSRTWSPSSVTKSASELKAYQLQRYPIHNGRPAHLTGPPIIIYEAVFADIVDDLAHLNDLSDDENILARTGELAIHSLEIYSSDSERASVLSPLISTLLDVVLNRSLGTANAVAKEAVAKEIDATYLHIEYKNETGMDGIVDFQGVLTLLKCIADPKYSAIRNKTCCPCIHILVTGPYISFGGSIFTDIYNFQPFTEYIYLGGPFMESKIRNTAKIFYIFRVALRKLRQRYRELDYCNPTMKDHSRLFPRPAYPANSDIPNLAFEKQLVPNDSHSHPRHTLFHATYDGRPVVVKFSERYNPDAHRAVAEVDLAPKLLFHAKLRGAVHMVIMEPIEGSDAHREFGNRVLPEDVIKQVKAALSVLHNMQLVHGDVRRSNILVKKKPETGTAMDVDPPQHGYRAYLVDFDGIGQAGLHRYSPLLNMQIPWPLGVRPGGTMEKLHDELMLEKIIHTDT